MDPSRAFQDDPPLGLIDPNSNKHVMEQTCDLTDSLNRLSLVNASATPLPPSSSLLSPNNVASRPVPVKQPTPRRTPSSSSLRDERRKSTPGLQKRQSTASLRSAAGNTGSSSPLDSSRRSSANFAGSPTSTASPAMLPPRLAFAPPEPQGPTAASIAAEHFQKEVDLHQSVDLGSKTVVVVHDACYGHRFSRPRTTKAQLSTIVERPERIRACVVGVAAAYVLLGRRYAGEPFAPHPHLDLHNLPPPPFQIRKSSRSLPLTDEAVTSVHGTKWMTELKGMCDLAESRLALTGKELVRTRTQDNDGLASSGPELHSGDLYLCSESQNAFQGALGAVCDGLDLVFGQGPTTRAFVCIRPPGHHCSADFPSGFCWVNNVHVGISYAAAQYGLTHAAILDFDLHHGDGSQDIAWDHNQKAWTASRKSSAYEKTPIGYYSLHDINSYPCEDGNPEKVRNASVCMDGAHGQSIWNVHLDTWETENDFWKIYRNKYMILISKARAFLKKHTKQLAQNPNGPPPKAAIFISAGFDASEWEGIGMQRHRVNVPTEFYARFTEDVVRISQEEGLGVDGRVISVLEGGYSDRALTSGVISHLAGLGTASANAQLRRPSIPGISPKDTLKPLLCQPEYDVSWWSPHHLDELEALVTTPIKSRDKSAPTFLNSTRSFSAKVVTPTRDRRSIGSSPGADPSLPPLPDVGWATAAHELSKILIPDSRQTMSCRPEDLNAAASRQRLERQVALDGGVVNPAIIPPPPPAPVDDKRQLRVRKAKSPTPYSPRPATPRQQAMRKNRRKTIDGNELPDGSSESSPSVDAGRRKSATGVTPVAIDLNASNEEQKTSRRTASAGSQPTPSSSAKKTSTSRPATPKRSASPRKPPPVPKVPSPFLSRTKSSDGVIRPQDDMENLSSGLRKIKLRMPSPEEQAAREKKAAEERKHAQKVTKTPKSPRSAKKTTGIRSARRQGATRSGTTPAGSPPVPPAEWQLGADGATPHTLNNLGNLGFGFGISSDAMLSTTASGSGSIEPMQTAFKPSESITPVISPSIGTMPVFFASNSPPLTPDHYNQNMNVPRTQSNVFSPPTSETQTKAGLPVFTSNAAIPFATGVQKENKPLNLTTNPQDHPQNG
ncbi:hypothetical protein N7540_010265 [Penicillium herquei]|nr:hypothetical protein N7540_010265 [Penicillium herquei]